MRTKKEEKTKIDLSIPVNIDSYNLSEEDCFGNLWLPSDNDCSLCADNELCGVIYSNKIKKKKAEFEFDNKTIDNTRFNEVNWDLIKKQAINYKKENNPMTFTELFMYVKDVSKCDNDVVIETYIEANLLNHNLCKKDGLILPL